ncbi:hypothetical protein DNHGIG_25960 [Collibacillus ludicampi]|uniref:Uncharacterized protein n=1 Tax=Collibacillus ludicampi TaxID=2771369 RepID=A0AAV4LGW5_9BACL|nr:putative phage tail protein [Collibacillus ludicampi]GIM47047.1 hypothetical protein DNHGIG_25960 [Collibacillus ludicampi]
MGQALNLLNRLSNIFTKDPNSILGQLFGAVGAQLDAVDPAQTNLASQFAVSTATGDALDKHGKDWGVPRRYGESDDAYRARILAVLPIYTNGPTVQAISTIVQNFTGVPPIIIEYGPDGFTMGVSPMGQFVFSDEDPFTFQIQVQNPNNVPYKRADLEAAVNQAKPARSTAIFVHQGGV